RIRQLEYERGWLIHPRQAYLGFSRLVRALTRELKKTRAVVLNHAEDIAVCFDKPSCQERLAEGGIPIPTHFGSPAGYPAVREHLGKTGRVMLKLAHGSGAAGCVAMHASHGRVRALTTVEELPVHGRSRLYCSKRIRVLTDEFEIAALTNRLCTEKV